MVSYEILLGSTYTTLVKPAWRIMSALPETTAWRYMHTQDESSSAETSGSDDGSSEDEIESVAEGPASSALAKTDLFVTGQSETTTTSYCDPQHNQPQVILAASFSHMKQLWNQSPWCACIQLAWICWLPSNCSFAIPQAGRDIKFSCQVVFTANCCSAVVCLVLRHLKILLYLLQQTVKSKCSSGR